MRTIDVRALHTILTGFINSNRENDRNDRKSIMNDFYIIVSDTNSQLLYNNIQSRFQV